MNETGAVKFGCEHVKVRVAPFAKFDELRSSRAQLRQLGLLGVDAQGIGFGNVSVRAGLTNAFYITGSATGAAADLTLYEVALVTAVDFDGNSLRCEGSTVASSESLTHAAAYDADATIGAVIHGHSARLWQHLRDIAPTTPATVEYGTPAMAQALRDILQQPPARESQLIVMAGHTAGIIAVGADTRDALSAIAKYVNAAPN